MKVRVKVIRKPVAESVDWANRLREFEKSAGSVDCIKRVAVAKHYTELFHKELEAEALTILAYLRVRYELEYRDRKSTGAIITDSFKQNYNAAQSMKLDMFNSTMQTLVGNTIKEEYKMKGTKAVRSENAKKGIATFQKLKGKTLGLGASETWVYLFERNETLPKAKKLTDEQISKFMHSEFPGRKSKIFDQVQLVRRAYYNKGRCVGQGGKPPKLISQAYAAGGVPEKETKAPVKKDDERLAAPRKLAMKVKLKAKAA